MGIKLYNFRTPHKKEESNNIIKFESLLKKFLLYNCTLFIAKFLPTLCVLLDSVYVTMSTSTGLYPNLDLKSTNKLHDVTLH